MQPSTAIEEKRRRNQDRRKYFERRVKRDPYYMGEVRRLIVDRRSIIKDRRFSAAA